MQLLQVIHSQGGEPPRVVANAERFGLSELRERGMRPELWGSRDLLKIATRLVHDETFRVRDCTLADLRFNIIQNDEVAELQDTLIRNLNSGDFQEIEQFQRSALLDYMVVAVVLSRRNPLGQLRLLQNGQLQVISGELTPLISAVERAASDQK